MNKAAGSSFLLFFLFALLIGGCSNCPQELEQAKKRITVISAEKDELRGRLQELETQKSATDDKVAELEKKNSSLAAEVAGLARSVSALKKEKAALHRKYNDTAKELSRLKTENSALADKIKMLNSRIEALTTPQESGSSIREKALPGVPRKAKSGLPDESVSTAKPEIKGGNSPCEAIVEFMHKCSAAIRRLSGDKRAARLSILRKEYADKTKGAPSGAMERAAAWVKELNAVWDKTGGQGDAVFKLLKMRNAVLKACGKTPSQAGF